MEDENILIILVAGLFLLLGFSLFVNINNTFGFLADPLAGDGLGTLCDNEENCRNFCRDNFGRCSDYCAGSPSNELCNKLFGNYYIK